MTKKIIKKKMPIPHSATAIAAQVYSTNRPPPNRPPQTPVTVVGRPPIRR